MRSGYLHFVRKEYYEENFLPMPEFMYNILLSGNVNVCHVNIRHEFDEYFVGIEIWIKQDLYTKSYFNVGIVTKTNCHGLYSDIALCAE
jgi:hypothetical protein